MRSFKNSEGLQQEADPPGFTMLFVIVSLTSITLGAVITLQAQTRPVQRHRLEYIGGLLIIAGLAVIGIGLAKLGAGFPSLAGR